MRALNQIGTANLVFLSLNVIGAITGLVLMIVIGPNVPLILLTLGSVGLALKKLGSLLGPDKAAITPPTKDPV